MQCAPRLVVGLGNPGAEYSETRHNAGFWFCERLAARLGLALARQGRFQALVAQAHPAGVWLLLPLTYMNRSGVAVGAFARFYRIESAAILVAHDDLDIPPGQLRLKFGGGSGGHNGLKDISAHLGTHEFWRLRIGIGHPGQRDQVIDYVLHPPRSEERVAIDAAIERALDLWPLIAKGAWNAATQRANTRVLAPHHPLPSRE